MKKLRKLLAMLLIGIGAMTTVTPTPALAERNIKTLPGRSEDKRMDESLSSVQKEHFLIALDEAMAILRDDKPFAYDKTKFGSLKRVESTQDELGARYYYNDNSLPEATIRFVSEADPLNYLDDRFAVPSVPYSFFFQFFALIRGMDRQELEKRLSLASYWVDTEGEKHDGNSLPSFPPALHQHVYRYRAKELATSHFPVDVELFYVEEKDGDEKHEPLLDAITIRRAYPYLTPEMRKKKREDQYR